METEGESGHCLFLSHSGADTEEAQRLRQCILTHPDARQHGLMVWFDKDPACLVAGKEWQKQIEEAIDRKATAFAVYVGSKGVNNWVEREVRLGLSRATKEPGFPFIPVLAPSATGSSALPSFAAQYQAVRHPLENERALQELITAALRGAVIRPTRTDHPFIGLRSMTEEWSDRFFGRDEEVDQLIKLMRRHRLVAIVAESGAGKSSLAQAGVIPHFRGGALENLDGREPDGRLRHVVVMRPGTSPLQGLMVGVDNAARGLGLDDEQRYRLRQRVAAASPFETANAIRCDQRTEDTQTLLVIDQFEELVILTPPEQRQEFAGLMLALLDQGIQILLTMRSDYFNLLRSFAELWGELGKDNAAPVFRLRRINDKGIRDAVCRPLLMAGQQNEEDRNALATAFVRDLMDRPGDLALAQMALEATWRHAGPSGNLMAAYTDLGGISGALAKEADRVRERKLTDAEQALLVPLFVRLIRPGETGGVTRRIARFEDLGEARGALARKLCSEDMGRLLLTVGDDAVEIAHEALITQWSWLQDQIGQSGTVEAVRKLGELMEEAQGWWQSTEADRQKGLANEASIDRFASLAAGHGEWLSEKEQTFLRVSQAALNKSKSRKKLLFYAAVAMAVIFAGLFSATGWSLRTAVTAERAALAEKENAERQKILAIKNQVSALAALSKATLGEDPVRALKLALSAWPRNKDDDLPKTQVALNAIANAHNAPKAARIFEGTSAMASVSWSSSGKLLAAGSDDGSVNVWNADTGEAVARLDEHRDPVRLVDWNPRGDKLLSCAVEKGCILWSAATWKRDANLSEGDHPVADAAWSPDGQRLATLALDGTLALWDPVTGGRLKAMKVLPPENSDDDSGLMLVDLNPDSRRIAVASRSLAKVYDIESEKEVARFELEKSEIYALKWNHRGDRLALGDEAGSVLIWAAIKNNLAVKTLDGEGNGPSVRRLEWNNADTRLAIASDDVTGKIWDVDGEAPLIELYGHESVPGRLQIVDIGWNGDGTLVATASVDGTARIWSATDGTLVATLAGHESPLTDLEWSPMGTRLATSASFYDEFDPPLNDKTVRLWMVSNLAIEQVLRHDRDVKDFQWHPATPSVLATIAYDGAAHIWDTDLGREIRKTELKGSPASEDVMLNDVAWSADGSNLAIGLSNGQAAIWDGNKEVPIYLTKGPGGAVERVLWSPSGRLLAAVTGSDWPPTEGKEPANYPVLLWNVAMGGEPIVLPGHIAQTGSVAWAPDESWIATSDGSEIRIWSAKGGQPIQSLHGKGNGAGGLAISSAINALVSRDGDGFIRLWNTDSWSLAKEIPVKMGGAGTSQLSSDGRRLLAYDDTSIGVIDLTDGSLLFSNARSAGLVTGIGWNVDSSRVAITQADGPLEVLEAASGQVIAQTQGRSNSEMAAAWSSGGSRIAAANGSEIVVLNATGIANKNLFELACESILDKDISEIAVDYGIGIEAPICADPSAIPLPQWGDQPASP